MHDRFLGLLSRLMLAALCCVPLAAQTDGTRDILHIPGRDNLGTEINSPDIEIVPVISPDGTTLYLDRKYSFDNVGGTEDDDDIYYSVLRPDGTWSAAVNIGAPLNTPGSDVLYWIAPDGNTALVQNGGKEKGRSIGLAISRRVNGVWGKPSPVSVQGLNTSGDDIQIAQACISPDGQRLILAYAPAEGDPDNIDLFSCPALGTDYMQWGAPETLGATINTIGPEWSPWIASDNRTFYFVSQGHMASLGASDVFMARRVGNGWDSWSDPVNLGDTVNTPGHDVSFCPAPDGLYAYTSAEAIIQDDTYGKTDIFRVPISPSFRPLPYGIVTGRLGTAAAGVQGLVRVEDAASGAEVGSTRSDQAGNFRFILPAGVRYRFTGWADGYGEATAEVELKKGGEIVGDVRITMIPGPTASSPRRR